jgi:8-oxo-dGTP diphosphatase/putative hydrolase of the HAD superfamily
LDALGIGKFFDVVVSSAEAGCKKPDLRIFRMALAQAGSRYEHEPWRTVMVGDRLDNDIYPANQLGMKTIRIMQGYAVGQKPRSCEWEPDATVARLTELLSIF